MRIKTADVVGDNVVVVVVVIVVVCCCVCGAVVACCVCCEAREILDKYYVRFEFLSATAELLWIFHTELDDLRDMIPFIAWL